MGDVSDRDAGPMKGPDPKRHPFLCHRDAACPAELLWHFVLWFFPTHSERLVSARRGGERVQIKNHILFCYHLKGKTGLSHHTRHLLLNQHPGDGTHPLQPEDLLGNPSLLPRDKYHSCKKQREKAHADIIFFCCNFPCQQPDRTALKHAVGSITLSHMRPGAM